MHKRNKHTNRYDFDELIEACPELSEHVIPNIHKDRTIDFSNPAAVKSLNSALLKCYYNIDYWDIPEGFLCPPIPGRADYLHHVSDVLGSANFGNIPHGNQVRCLDVGVGANCIYPIVGVNEYGWSFVGSEIDEQAISSAQKIIDQNSSLKDKVELRLQKIKSDIFFGVIADDDKFDLTICNPPFHSSSQEAKKGTHRKLNNLNKKKVDKLTLNFGGKNNELWCEGGERLFIQEMVFQSKRFSKNCLWFSTLVSKQSNLKGIYANLDTVNAKDVQTIKMGIGNKSSRIVVWTFHSKSEIKEWISQRW